MLKLAKGKSFSVSETDKEFALIVLGGTCTVKGGTFCFEKVGKRKSPFDGVAEGVYIGKDTPFNVTAVGGDVRICVAKSHAEKAIEPYRIEESEVRTKMLGKGPFERFAAFNLDEGVRHRDYISANFGWKTAIGLVFRRINTTSMTCPSKVRWTRYTTSNSISLRGSVFSSCIQRTDR